MKKWILVPSVNKHSDSKASAKDALQFRIECKQFFAAVTKKILERSPVLSRPPAHVLQAGSVPGGPKDGA